jgi:hypothetical protein
MDADVDMKGYVWQQLNTSASSYRYWINFDGRGHLIRNLTPSSESGYPSFFGTLCGECRNVGFVDAEIVSEGSTAGILCGSMGYTSYKDADGNPYTVVVENCYFTGKITARGYVGVIAGTLSASPAVIRNVYTVVDVAGSGTSRNYCGGIVGRVNSEMIMENCYSAGSIKAPTAAPIAAGGQKSTTPASTYNNVIAWNKSVEGIDEKSDVTSFAFIATNDKLENTYSFSQMQLNGETVANGKSHKELQNIVASWGGAWHSDPAAGNGYPILKWQYERGDYRENCGFSDTNAIDVVPPSAGSCNEVYDLRGVKVENPTRGIFIINGKKVMLK